MNHEFQWHLAPDNALQPPPVASSQTFPSPKQETSSPLNSFRTCHLIPKIIPPAPSPPWPETCFQPELPAGICALFSFVSPGLVQHLTHGRCPVELWVQNGRARAPSLHVRMQFQLICFEASPACISSEAQHKVRPRPRLPWASESQKRRLLPSGVPPPRVHPTAEYHDPLPVLRKPSLGWPVGHCDGWNITVGIASNLQGRAFGCVCSSPKSSVWLQ